MLCPPAAAAPAITNVDPACPAGSECSECRPVCIGGRVTWDTPSPAAALRPWDESLRSALLGSLTSIRAGIWNLPGTGRGLGGVQGSEVPAGPGECPHKSLNL